MAVWKTPRKKKYQGLCVDYELNKKVLDKLNLKPNLQVISVCAGHRQPTEPHEKYFGNYPEVIVRSKHPKKTISKAKKNPHTRVWYSKKDKMIRIRGTKEGKKEKSLWWNKIAKSII